MCLNSKKGTIISISWPLPISSQNDDHRRFNKLSHLISYHHWLHLNHIIIVPRSRHANCWDLALQIRSTEKKIQDGGAQNVAHDDVETQRSSTHRPAAECGRQVCPGPQDVWPRCRWGPVQAPGCAARAICVMQSTVDHGKKHGPHAMHGPTVRSMHGLLHSSPILRGAWGSCGPPQSKSILSQLMGVFCTIQQPKMLRVTIGW